MGVQFMDYVKGCDINTLSKRSLKKIAEGKIEICEGLRDQLSLETLSDMLADAKVDFVNGDGKTIKNMPSGEVFYYTKKIEKKKYIIGISFIRRIAGEPSGKTGIQSWFEESPDKYIEEKRIFAEGFEKEEEYIDHNMIEHFRNSVGLGQVSRAEYKDKLITRVKTKKVLGYTISTTLLFILMIIVWGLIFDNFGIGLCFALCFCGSFSAITTKAKSEETDLVTE